MKNDYEWGFENPADFLSHHGIMGMHWGQRNGPPYPLSRTGKWSSGERRAGAVKKVKETAGKVASAGKQAAAKVSAKVKTVGKGSLRSSGNGINKHSAATSVTRGTSSGSSAPLSKKTKRLQQKAANYAKKNNLSNDYNATAVKNAKQEELDNETSSASKDYKKWITNFTYKKQPAIELYVMKLEAEESEAKDRANALKKSAARSTTRGTEPSNNTVNINIASNNQRPSSEGQSSWDQDPAYRQAHSKKPVSLMSNEELGRANSRMQLEQNYYNLRNNTARGGEKFVRDVKDKLYGVAIEQVGNVARYATNSVLSSALNTPWPPPGGGKNKNK